MKRILFIFISYLLYMDGMAQETQIQLYKENVDDWVKDDRSLPIMPTATHDGNIISIYSDMPIEKLEIAIKDTYKTSFIRLLLQATQNGIHLNYPDYQKGNTPLN